MSTPPSKWSDIRDFCSAVREIAIVSAMLSLLVVPTAVRKSLERAGIRSVAGVEFDIEDIAQSRDELDAALVQINSLKSQLANAQQQVQGLADTLPLIASTPPGPSSALSTMRAESSLAPTPSPAPSFASVSRLLASMKDQAEETDRSLRRSRVHTEKFLEQVGSEPQLTPPAELFRNQRSAPESAAQLEDESQIRR